jgi:hypothetical protein
VIQRGKGGSRGPKNCLPACTPCNRLRWHRTGKQLRDLLLRGIVATGEIQRDTEMGQSLVKKMRQRLATNRRRRASRTERP